MLDRLLVLAPEARRRARRDRGLASATSASIHRARHRLGALPGRAARTPPDHEQVPPPAPAGPRRRWPRAQLDRMRVRGGQNLYGFSVGILMLDTRFPRIPGDMGNAATSTFPVRYHRVTGASPDRVVRQGQRELLPAFVEGARFLEREGVRAITTNCGFLAQFQSELAAAVSVPVFTSSLMLVPLVTACCRRAAPVGILTVDAKSLHAGALARGRHHARTCRSWWPGSRESRSSPASFSTISSSWTWMRPAQEHLAVARRLLAAHPEIGRDRARVHEHAALPRRHPGGDGPARLRHHDAGAHGPRRARARPASASDLRRGRARTTAAPLSRCPPANRPRCSGRVGPRAVPAAGRRRPETGSGGGRRGRPMPSPGPREPGARPRWCSGKTSGERAAPDSSRPRSRCSRPPWRRPPAPR